MDTRIVEWKNASHAMNTCLHVLKRNKMDSELLMCLLKFIEYFPHYLLALSCTLIRFFGQPLSKQLYGTVSVRTVVHFNQCP